MVAIANLYSLDHVQSWDGGEEFHNIYFYFDEDGIGTAEGLVGSFFEDVLPFVLDLQTNFARTERIVAYSLGDLDNYWEAIYSGVVGTFSMGDGFPMHDAVNLTLRLNTRAVRPGSKRISGIPEASATNGVFTDSGWLSNLNLLRNALKDTLDDGATANVFAPVVVKRVREGSAPNYTYRLPETDGEAQIGYVTGVLYNARVSHQVSRGNSR